jgi:hypothetical protein
LEGGYDAHFVGPHHPQNFPHRTRIPLNRAFRHKEKDCVPDQRKPQSGSVERI